MVYMAKDCQNGGASYKNVHTVNLDEYVGLTADHNQSYAYFMRTNLFDYIDIDSIDNLNHKIKETKHLPVSDAPSRASRAVQTGSVLFSLVRPYLENIALIEEKHANSIASTGFYICNSTGALYPKYMFYLMISGYVVGGLNQFMKGDNSPSISKDNIESWLYPIPPFAEQKIICQKLEAMLSKIEAIEKSLS